MIYGGIWNAIETKEEHKQKGLGLIVANKMIRYSMNQNKSPVWACYYKNIASARMAEKFGFCESGRVLYHKEEINRKILNDGSKL